jgi:ppGpp synthetase/RelA/SpoT-type nucleotidyltranferase
MTHPKDYSKELLKEYSIKKEIYRDFALAIKNILKQLLADKKIKYQHITCREKAVDKLAEKIERKKNDGKIYRTLDDIEDLSGVRIVFYLESEKKRFQEVLNSEFGESIKKHEEKWKQGGYRATHFIIKLNKGRTKLTEYCRFINLNCELQLTSSLYHAWSEVEHDIVYKQLDKNSQLQKDLGLDELDKAFEEVMEKHIQTATHQLDLLKQSSTEIAEAGNVFASNFTEEIRTSKSNDDIFKKLEIIEKYYHKKPEEMLSVVTAILSKKPNPAQVIHKFKDAKLYGKIHQDLEIKTIEIIRNLCYDKPDECLKLIASLMRQNDSKIKNAAREVLEKFTKYDYNILKTKIGYGIQGKVLDFISNWSDIEKLVNIDFVETATREILRSTVEGTSYPSFDKITFHSSAVDPTEFLKKIRRKTIDLIVRLYKAIDDIAIKLRLVTVLDQVSQTPSYGTNDKIDQMIFDDSQYLVDIYRNMVFDDDAKIREDLAVIEVIEKKLYWLHRNERFKTLESVKLRKDILENPFYKIFRLLIGDSIDYDEEIGFSKIGDVRKKDIDGLIKNVTKKNLLKWTKNLNLIAGQSKWIDQWKFLEFNQFLRKITNLKPDIADSILEDSFNRNSSLKWFTKFFLDGFRDINRLDLWDKYTQKIIKGKDSKLTEAIISSLRFDDGVDLKKVIRKKDLELLQRIVKKTKPFGFLKKDENIILHYSLINVLARNYRRDDKLIEELIIYELKQNQSFSVMHIKQLSSALHWKSLDISKWKNNNLEFLLEIMVKLPELDWDAQEILLNIAKFDIKMIFNILKKRIKKDHNDKKKRERKLIDKYEAIPYHINPDLKEYISSHSEYEKEMEKWIKNMTADWSIYDWHVSHFIQRIGGPFKNIIVSLVRKKDDENLIKAVRILTSFDAVDFEICIEIIRATKNRRIISLTQDAMYSTGIVSGENGLAEAYERKADILIPFLKDKDSRVRKFSENMKKSFESSAISERKRTEEESIRRKMDFNGI